jgi:hypothetical protein
VARSAALTPRRHRPSAASTSATLGCRRGVWSDAPLVGFQRDFSAHARGIPGSAPIGGHWNTVPTHSLGLFASRWRQGRDRACLPFMSVVGTSKGFLAPARGGVSVGNASEKFCRCARSIAADHIRCFSV